MSNLDRKNTYMSNLVRKIITNHKNFKKLFLRFSPENMTMSILDSKNSSMGNLDRKKYICVFFSGKIFYGHFTFFHFFYWKNEKFLTYHQKMKFLPWFCIWKTRKIQIKSVFYNSSFFLMKKWKIPNISSKNENFTCILHLKN